MTILFCLYKLLTGWMVLCFITKSRLVFLSTNFLKDDDYVPVMKESNIDVKALSNAYKEKKKIRDDSNVVKIGEARQTDCFLSCSFGK